MSSYFTVGKVRSDSSADGTLQSTLCAEEAQHQLSVLVLQLWEQEPYNRSLRAMLQDGQEWAPERLHAILTLDPNRPWRHVPQLLLTPGVMRSPGPWWHHQQHQWHSTPYGPQVPYRAPTSLLQSQKCPNTSWFFYSLSFFIFFNFHSLLFEIYSGLSTFILFYSLWSHSAQVLLTSDLN